MEMFRRNKVAPVDESAKTKVSFRTTVVKGNEASR